MALPIGLGVVWIVGVENPVINVAATLLDFADEWQKFLPGVNAWSRLGAWRRERHTGVNSTVDGSQAAFVLIAYAFVLSAGVALQRRDVRLRGSETPCRVYPRW